jgi:hypothetical protein
MSCVDADSLLSDLKAIVHDELKIVSYKWLARQYSIPSNFAKQILFKFAEGEGAKVKAVYLVSGYLKEDSTQHVVRLVDASDLAGCCSKLETQTSIHVYRWVLGKSVESSVPSSSSTAAAAPAQQQCCATSACARLSGLVACSWNIQIEHMAWTPLYASTITHHRLLCDG